MTSRTSGIILITVAILFLPYWIYLPLLLVGIVVFPFFWEGILLALFIDLAYGGGVATYLSFISPVALVALVLLIILIPVRERVRNYA